MGKVLNVMMFIVLLLYILSYDKPAPAPAPPTTTTIANVTETSTTSTTLDPYGGNYTEYRIQIINKTRYINIENITRKTVYDYQVMNLSRHQAESLIDMKPDVCHTIGCSDGFAKCKREALSILELKGPKFRETFSRGYDPFAATDKENTSLAQFRVHTDIAGEYILLNGTFWSVSVPLAYQLLNETAPRYENVTIIREGIKLRRQPR